MEQIDSRDRPEIALSFEVIVQSAVAVLIDRFSDAAVDGLALSEQEARYIARDIALRVLDQSAPKG